MKITVDIVQFSCSLFVPTNIRNLHSTIHAKYLHPMTDRSPTLPVMYEAASESKKDTTFATSSTLPIRPKLIFFISSSRSRTDFSVISVAMKPGSTTLLRTLNRPISFAIERENPRSADFVIAYPDWPIRPPSPTILPNVTILPFRCFIICGRTACVIVIVPRILVSTIASSSLFLARIAKLSMLTPT